MFRHSFRFGSFDFVHLFSICSCLHRPRLAQTNRSPVAPTREEAEAIVREAYNKFRSDTSGKNADYIPYLAQVDSKLVWCSYSYDRQPGF